MRCGAPLTGTGIGKRALTEALAPARVNPADYSVNSQLCLSKPGASGLEARRTEYSTSSAMSVRTWP